MTKWEEERRKKIERADRRGTEVGRRRIRKSERERERGTQRGERWINIYGW